MAKVIIIGAGISGLAAAHWIHRQGYEVVILEKSQRAGGAIETVRSNGFLFEKGPNAFLDNVPEMMDLCSELELENELIKQSMRGNKRFIYLNGKLHEVPTGPGAFFKTELLSPEARKQILTEMFHKGNRSPEDESLAAFIRRRLGDEVLDHVVTPFVSGVYAGDPEQLSLRGTFPFLYDLERSGGSLTWGLIKRIGKKKKEAESKPKKSRAKNLCSFVEGMSVLTEALALELKNQIHYNFEVKEIRRQIDGKFSIIKKDETIVEAGDVVVFAAPAYAAGTMAAALIPKSQEYLCSIPHNRLTVAGMGYRREAVAHECSGFGFLSPRNQGIRILGSIWSSSLFPRRAPKGMRTFTVFIGGGLDPNAYDLNDEALYKQIREDLKPTMGVSGAPVHQELFRWEKAIPQYPVGHVEQIEMLQKESASVPGLYFTGNYLDGVSTNDCIRNAKRIAEAVHQYLSRTS